jgi:hypothetical protein
LRSRTIEIVKRLLRNDPCKKKEKSRTTFLLPTTTGHWARTLYSLTFFTEESGGYFASGAMTPLNITQ